MGAATSKENCDPIARAREIPSSKILRQFHSTTSRGAYKVWATAIAVKMIPKVPHAAPISGCANQSAVARMIPGEKQYSESAVYPPALPYKRRATYHNEAPSSAPKIRYGACASHPQWRRESICNGVGQNSNPTAAIRYQSGEWCGS